MGVHNVQGSNGDFMAPQDHHAVSGIERSQESAGGNQLDALRERIQVEQARMDKTNGGASDTAQRFGPAGPATEGRLPQPANAVAPNSTAAAPEMQTRNLLTANAMTPNSSAQQATMAGLPPVSAAQAAVLTAQPAVIPQTSTLTALNMQATTALNPNNAPPPVLAANAARMQNASGVMSNNLMMRSDKKVQKKEKQTKEEEEEAEEAAAKNNPSLTRRMIKLAKLLTGLRS